MVTTFRPQTMQEAVLQELRRRIHDGELRPGTVIRVDAVAGALGVSRIPVREALMILEGEGLVTHRPHVGFTVPSLTAEEIYCVRALLEDEALRRALENTKDADRATAREACRAAEEALHHGQVNAFSDNGRRFHEALLVPCHMPRLLRLLAGLWEATESYRAANRLDRSGQEILQAEHQIMLDAFVAGDEQRLIEAAEQHRQHLLAGAQLGTCPPTDTPTSRP